MEIEKFSYTLSLMVAYRNWKYSRTCPSLLQTSTYLLASSGEFITWFTLNALFFWYQYEAFDNGWSFPLRSSLFPLHLFLFLVTHAATLCTWLEIDHEYAARGFVLSLGFSWLTLIAFPLWVIALAYYASRRNWPKVHEFGIGLMIGATSGFVFLLVFKATSPSDSIIAVLVKCLAFNKM